MTGCARNRGAQRGAGDAADRAGAPHGTGPPGGGEEVARTQRARSAACWRHGRDGLGGGRLGLRGSGLTAGQGAVAGGQRQVRALRAGSYNQFWDEKVVPPGAWGGVLEGQAWRDTAASCCEGPGVPT